MNVEVIYIIERIVDTCSETYVKTWFLFKVTITTYKLTPPPPNKIMDIYDGAWILENGGGCGVGYVILPS